jgi:hypothetical protein
MAKVTVEDIIYEMQRDHFGQSELASMKARIRASLGLTLVRSHQGPSHAAREDPTPDAAIPLQGVGSSRSAIAIMTVIANISATLQS